MWRDVALMVSLALGVGALQSLVAQFSRDLSDKGLGERLGRELARRGIDEPLPALIEEVESRGVLERLAREGSWMPTTDIPVIVPAELGPANTLEQHPSGLTGQPMAAVQYLRGDGVTGRVIVVDPYNNAIGVVERPMQRALSNELSIVDVSPGADLADLGASLADQHVQETTYTYLTRWHELGGYWEPELAPLYDAMVEAIQREHDDWEERGPVWISIDDLWSRYREDPDPGLYLSQEPGRIDFNMPDADDVVDFIENLWNDGQAVRPADAATFLFSIWRSTTDAPPALPAR